MTQSTHDLGIGEEQVVKVFRTWDRGEPDREWEALCLLAETAPGLVPNPVERRTVGDRPAVVMTRLPGGPLGGTPLSGDQVAAVAAAMTRLHSAVPPARLIGRSPRLWGPSEAVADLREAYAATTADGASALAPPVASAVREARRWLASQEASSLTTSAGDEVFAQADGNLGNYLWDGASCRLVDFEDSGVSDRAFEVADLLEHVSVGIAGVIEPECLIEALDAGAALRRRVHGMRRLFAALWLLMLLPGNRGHVRNPPGSLESQAARTLSLLA